MFLKSFTHSSNFLPLFFSNQFLKDPNSSWSIKIFWALNITELIFNLFDFFSSGLAFDDMNGEFTFLNSQAKANNLVLKGSFGEMRVNGFSDLKNKTHDQLLVYIPDLSSMSLISGTLLGGPVGALASIFYDKFLEQIGIDTNQLAAVEYSIQGSWDKPEIKVIEPFKPITN